MSALAPRNSYRITDEQEWLESSDNVDLSPASVWAPDYEEEDETTLQGKRVDAQYIEPDVSEPGGGRVWSLILLARFEYWMSRRCFPARHRLPLSV
mgnify:CR=1 FL=1